MVRYPKVMWRLVLSVSGLLVHGCGEDRSDSGATPEQPVFEFLSERNGFGEKEVLPPLLSRCETGDPDYDPGPPPTLRGEAYNPFEHDWCTISFTRRYRIVDGQFGSSEQIHVIRTESEAPEPEDWFCDGCLYCTIEQVASVSNVPELQPLFDDLEIENPEFYAQRFQSMIVAVDGAEPCRSAFTVGDTLGSEVAMRTNDPNVIFFLTDDLLGPQDGALHYDGLFGIPDTGGTVDLVSGGTGFLYHDCGLTADGPCTPSCRTFRAANGFELCSWDDVPYLPYLRELVSPEWAERYPERMERVYDGD